MKVGLFVPCYIDQFYPNVAKASLAILERLGFEVEFPLNQSCCGQPMVNSGFTKEGERVSDHFKEVFQDFDYVVGPSGSCVHHLIHHAGIGKNEADTQVYELFSFISEYADIPEMTKSFPHKVGFHFSCHALRGLRLGSSSELVEEPHSVVKPFLDAIPDVEWVPLDNIDECCGFGGTFSVFESDVSVDMGRRRLEDHKSHGAEYIISMDSSCLMHLQGVSRKQNDGIQFLHLAELIEKVL